MLSLQVCSYNIQILHSYKVVKASYDVTEAAGLKAEEHQLSDKHILFN